MARISLGKTKNGLDVSVDLIHSHAATHIKDTPQLMDILPEIMPTLAPRKDYEKYEVDTGRIVGTQDLVETVQGDDIVYAMRPNRDVWTRFVKGRQPVPTRTVALHLKKIGETEYDLFTAYIGVLTPSFPGGEFETPESRPFWEKHALVWETQEVVPGTETRTRPW